MQIEKKKRIELSSSSLVQHFEELRSIMHVEFIINVLHMPFQRVDGNK